MSLAAQLLASILTASVPATSDTPLTVPERSGFQRTSTTAEVRAYLTAAEAPGTLRAYLEAADRALRTG